MILTQKQQFDIMSGSFLKRDTCPSPQPTAYLKRGHVPFLGLLKAQKGVVHVRANYGKKKPRRRGHFLIPRTNRDPAFKG